MTLIDAETGEISGQLLQPAQRTGRLGQHALAGLSGGARFENGATGVEATGGRRRIAGSDDDRGTERVVRCDAGTAPEHDV